MNLQQAGYDASMPSRSEQSNKITSGSGAKTVTFTKPFFTGTAALTALGFTVPKPSVTISPFGMGVGDYYELLENNITGTGFIIHFKNSSGASISKDFTYTGVGFGKGG